MNQLDNGANSNVAEGQFLVKLLSGKTIVSSLSPEKTVRHVKEEIFEKENIAVDQQRLVFMGKQLEDNATLASYQVTDGACIHLVLRLRGGGGEAGEGQFLVKLLSGKTIVSSLSPEKTVRHVKEEIFEKENIAVDQQRLVFMGKQLEDNATLASYQVTDGACIHLVLRLRG